MMEKSVKMSLVEFERLTEIENKYKEGITELFFKSYFQSGTYTNQQVTAYKADEGMMQLASELRDANKMLSKKRWYQFVELKK